MTNSAFLNLGLGLKAIFLVLLVGLSGCAKESSYRVADGSQMQLSELRGNWVLINYWADWCRPCREEIPELNTLHQREEGDHVTTRDIIGGDVTRSVALHDIKLA